MDVFPKFIIESDDIVGDCLIIAKCTYHKQLATDTTKVKGGGWWSLDRDKKTFILYGRSEDFGQANLDIIKQCVKNKNVYSNASLTKNLTDTYQFKYRDECGEVFEL